MADIKKVMKGLELCQFFGQFNCSQCDYIADCNALAKDARELLEKQQAEIERLNETLRIMYNRCICFRGSDYCSSCGQREECESKRTFWHGYHLVNHKRVVKGDEPE